MKAYADIKMYVTQNLIFVFFKGLEMLRVKENI